MNTKNNEKFEALRDAVLIRRDITQVLRNLSIYTQRHLENLSASLEHAANEDEYRDIQDKIRIEKFNAWLIKHECKTIADCSTGISGYLRIANTIYPSKESPAFIAELTERRVNLDRAIGACNVLVDELQYIAETVYADKNKFTSIVLKIHDLFNKIKRVRQSDNRLLKK